MTQGISALLTIPPTSRDKVENSDDGKVTKMKEIKIAIILF